MEIQGPLCIVPHHDNHWIIGVVSEEMIFLEVQDDGRLIPKLIMEAETLVRV